MVGYTNAGKSTLFNRLTGASVTADERMCARHFANTFFNVARGGIFDHDYRIP